MTYGLDPGQLRVHVINPVHRQLALFTPAADNLVLGTALHESHLKYLKQIRGPALGLWQMEPATHADIWRNFLAYNADLRKSVIRFLSQPIAPGDVPDPGEMTGNLFYACAMCRVHYRRVSEPLPANEPRALATYWKRHYNTVFGKGTVDQALPHFEVACK